MKGWYRHPAALAAGPILLALPSNAYLMGGDELVCIPTPGDTIGMGAPCAQYGGVDLKWNGFVNMDPVGGIKQTVLVDVDFQTGSPHTVLSDYGGMTGMFELNMKACDAEVGTCFSNLTATTADHGYIFDSNDVVSGSAAGTFNLSYVFPEMDICWTLVTVLSYYAQDTTTSEIFKLEVSIAKFQVVSSAPKIIINNVTDNTPLIIGLGVAGGLFFMILMGGIYAYRQLNKGRIPYVALEFNEEKPWKGTQASEIYKGLFKGTHIVIKRIAKGNDKRGDEESVATFQAHDGATSRNTIKTSSMNKNTFSTFSKKKSKVSSTECIIFDDNAVSTDKNNTMGGQDAVAALKQEIAFLSDLRHPNCLLYLGYAEKGDHLYAVTEIMPNGSLYEVLHNPCLDFDFEHKMKMSADISCGLDFLHSQKVPILHGDLKSQNVFVNEDLRGKIADFGASCREGRAQVSGTPLWMAPELFKGQPITTDSDTYALSLTLWELWNCAELFPEMKGKTIRELGEAIISGMRPPNDERRVPKEIAAVIERGWNEDQDSRPDVQSVHARLETLIANREFMLAHKEETKASDTELLYKILPPTIADQVKNGDTVEPMDVPACTILFSDIVGFTKISSSLQPKEVMNMLDRLYKEFDKLTERHQLFKVETIGDAYMVCGGLFERQEVQASMIALQGIEMIRAGSRVCIHPDRPELGNVKIRVGAHTGPVVASVVGKLNPRFCLFGDTVNTSSRMESNSIVSRFQGSKPFREKLMSEDPNFVTEYRGEVLAKGKAPMITYWIEAKDQASVKLIDEFPMPLDKEELGAMK